MKEYFLKLYQYNAWANERVINCVRKQEMADGKVLSLLGHVAAAQLLWLHRIKNIPPPAVVLWGDYSLVELASLCEKAGKEWLSYVEGEDNFDRDLHYANYSGDSYINNVQMIMIHVVNHSTYHRAQIAMLLRQKGYEPVNTDFITYDRIVRGQWKE